MYLIQIVTSVTCNNRRVCIFSHITSIRQVNITTNYGESAKPSDAHINSWCNIMHAKYRVRSFFQATNNAIPPEYGQRKDHKVFNDVIKGPPTRPVCGAVSSCNFRISYYFSNILKPFIALAEEACNISEDICCM